MSTTNSHPGGGDQPQTTLTEALSVNELYTQLATARVASLEDSLGSVIALPEPPAETLTFTAVVLSCLSEPHWSTAPHDSRRRADLAKRLGEQARALDAQADLLTESWLRELEQAGEPTLAELLGEVASALVWACAVLRHVGAWLSGREEGNAAELELAWLCLGEATTILMAADSARIAQREGER